MFDVFYTGPKPNVCAHEWCVNSIADAARQCKTKYFWLLDGANDYSAFDFNWVPDKWESEHLHIFPSQWQKDSSTYFVNPEARVVKHYRNEQHVLRKPIEFSYWVIPEDVDRDTIDFTWHPDPTDPPYRYQFPTKYQRASGVEYAVPSAINKKYVDAFKVSHRPNLLGWTIPDDVDPDSVDLGWRPDPYDIPCRYQFPSKFQKASGVSFSLRESARGETNEANKYISSFTVRHKQGHAGRNWIVPDNIKNPDLSWRPNPLDPPYIYKFPSAYVRESGLEYHVPGATEIKFVNDISVSFNAESLPRYYVNTTIEDLIAEHKDEVFWALNKEMDYNEFDFSWNPDVSQKHFIQVFGSQWQKHAATYYIDGPHASSTGPYQYNYVGDQTVRADSTVPIFFVDKSNNGSNERYKDLCSRFDNMSRVRFADNIFATIKRISSKQGTPAKFWVITSENDYTDFDFSWSAEPWQNYMLHVFGTEEQQWSETFLINKMVFDDHCRWVKEIENVPDLHFVQGTRTKAINVNDIYEIDFGQHDKRITVQHNKLITVQHETLKTTRFVDSYLSVIKRIVEHSKSDYIWITSNICDYTEFNFDWRPEPYQATMLHVFGPGNNKFGDTFLVHVETFKEQSQKLELLDWYDTVNYNSEQTVPRLPYDQVPYTGDDLTEVIKEHKFNSPYALFFPEGQDTSTITYNPSVWSLRDRSIHVFTESGSVVLAPRDTLQYLDTQCYDYPQIKRHPVQFLTEKPLDIVFISNGETHAQRNWEILQKMTRNVPNRVVHVQGVKGRAQAYKAAAAASETDWFFSVFAKLEVDQDFDWGWQTDRLQQPKHYIFYARNDTVGINYGHASIIAYNKKLVLQNESKGLDFTLDQEHEVVPVHSGVTYYNGDIMTAWRTSFREAIKLYKNIQEGNFVKESAERLEKWCSSNGTKEGDWNAKGGMDGVEYYEEVKGDFDSLRLSYDWEWLDAKYRSIYES